MDDLKDIIIQWLHNKIIGIGLGTGVITIAEMLDFSTKLAAFVLVIVVIISHFQDILIKKRKLKEMDKKEK